jgi:hypothetical protein
MRQSLLHGARGAQGRTVFSLGGLLFGWQSNAPGLGAVGAPPPLLACSRGDVVLHSALPNQVTKGPQSLREGQGFDAEGPDRTVK